jgi:hypothetical protein
MINPRLGLLALQALNPKQKGKTMAKRRKGARHMAWVRSFRKGRKNSPRRRRRRNPYPMAGTVAALANPRRRRRKHNPHHRRRRRNPVSMRSARGFFGLPPLMTMVYSGAGFAGTAMIQGFADTLVPVSMKTNTDGSPNLITKYVEIGGSIIAVTMLAKMLLGPGPAALMGIGGGVYGIMNLAHDMAPNMIPGMHSYTQLGMGTYVKPLPNSSMGRMGRSVASAGGGWPGLAAPDHGAVNSADFAAKGGMQLVGERFRRFA